MYTIKFGENTLRILSDIGAFSFKKIGKNKAVVYNYTKARKLIDLIREVTYSTVKNHIIFHSDTHLVFKELAKNFTCINAGGGLVINEQNQILFIFRNGKWDLPKGKIEANETTELGAVREVEEECGVKISKLKGKIDVTYHTYLLDNKHILKSNHWFLMHADSNQKLIPQAEENIEKVEWKRKDEIDRLLENSYDSIRELMELYKKDFKKDL
jgi:8-oxo-dGTP pyrophosphatase MutT (NUDIX family)